MLKKIGIVLMLGIVLEGAFSIAAYSVSIPLRINYQGRLADSSGTPVNGTKKLVFTIYNDAC